MRVILQRVRSSRVVVVGQTIGEIGRGFNLLVGIAATDTEAELEWMARKCLSLRLFPTVEATQPGANASGGGRWERSIAEIGGELLVVSQFTLYGDCRKGRRPSFDQSAAPEVA